jgi:hypothetical protein
MVVLKVRLCVSPLADRMAAAARRPQIHGGAKEQGAPVVHAAEQLEALLREVDQRVPAEPALRYKSL